MLTVGKNMVGNVLKIKCVFCFGSPDKNPVLWELGFFVFLDFLFFDLLFFFLDTISPFLVEVY